MKTVHRVGHEGKVNCILHPQTVLRYPSHGVTYALRALHCDMTITSSCDWPTCCLVYEHAVSVLLYTQVDLKCVDPASGGYYYPDHLPVLGEILHYVATLGSLQYSPIISSIAARYLH